MVTMTPIKDASGARSYFEKDDYYTRDSSGGRAWMGKGSESLGLTEVTPEAFQAVLEGKDLDGNTLVSAASNGVHRAGWDIQFAPSKSVALAWAFGNEQQRADIMACHNAAVHSTMQYVENNLIEGRVTVNNNTTRVTTGSMVAARFDHYTTREHDPAPHTHVVVADMTRCPDRKFRAVANEKIIKNREFAIAYYENETAALLKECGFSVTMEKYDTGNSHYASIEGIDEKITRHFSKRSDQIDQVIESMQAQYPEASRGELRQMACLGTRQAKQIVDREVLHESWDKQLETLGFSRESFAASIAQAKQKTTEMDVKPSEHDTVKMACSVLNEQESIFSREDVLKTAARLSGGYHRNTALESAFYDLKGSIIVTLDKNTGAYTTKDMKRIEKGIVASVKEGHDTVPAVLSVQQLERQNGQLYRHLTTDQKKALEHILTSTDKVIGIQGDAGTGKTTMLRAAREELEGQGYIARGLTFTGKAAKELQNEGGVESSTLHSFLNQSQAAHFVANNREVWFVDEASMVGSKQLDELMKVAKKTGARILLVGDTKQLQSISAGRMFGKLQETGAMKTVHMQDTIRQRGNPEYLEMVADIKVKRVDGAFEKMSAKGKIQEIADEKERLDAVVKRVISKKDHRQVLVVTPLNRDRMQINSKIREALQNKGILKAEEHTFTVREAKVIDAVDKHFSDSYSMGDYITTNGGIKGVKIGTKGRVIATDKQTETVTLSTDDGRRVGINVAKDGDKIKAFREKSVPFMHGEKVVFLSNDRALKVQNGLTGEITHIDARGNITVMLDKKKSITWNIRHGYNYLDHGYAVTDYKSQGQTTREVLIHANTERPISHNSLYTAFTRGREDVHIVTNDINTLKKQVTKEVRKTSSLDYDKTRNIPIQKTPSINKFQAGREGR